MSIRVALIGDFDPSIIAHRAIPDSLRLSARQLSVEVSTEWLPTDSIHLTQETSDFAAVWCVPGSPYTSTAGALAAIRIAREARQPFLGTCGGFQHAILEYARNVLGLKDAGHAEMNPHTSIPVIVPLSCSLIEENEDVYFTPGSRLRSVYLSDRATEQYHCNYGVNPEYTELFASHSGLRIGATTAHGEVRAIELVEHSFFVATLFQPERSVLLGAAHPLITAFLAAANAATGE
jgi:CTP synthase (UTP-ammonia lyase)